MALIAVYHMGNSEPAGVAGNSDYLMNPLARHMAKTNLFYLIESIGVVNDI